jgi:acyl-CoA thioester hydrolase
MEECKFSVDIQIRMSDLDPFIHVNNGAQCHLYDYGRSSYFEKVFGERIDWMSLDLVLIHLELDFKSPIFYHDYMVCDCRISKIGKKSLTMYQQLRNKDTNEIKSTCTSVLCGFDRHIGISLPLKEIYIAKIKAFESKV